MDRYFKLMLYPVDTWIDVVATRLIDITKAWLNGESQQIDTGIRQEWRSGAYFHQEMVSTFESTTKTKIARRQIIKLRQISRVSGYIQRFHTLRYNIPGMIEEEAFTLFLCGLQAGLQQQVGVHTQMLQEAMELAKLVDLWSK